MITLTIVTVNVAISKIESQVAAEINVLHVTDNLNIINRPCASKSFDSQKKLCSIVVNSMSHKFKQ